MRLIDAEQYRKEFLDSRDFEPMKILDFQPTVNAIVIPDNTTNGDIIKAMFPTAEVWKYDEEMMAVLFEGIIGVKLFTIEWWNAPYKRGNSDGSN